MMYVAAIFLPLLGSIVAGLFGRFIGDRGAQIVTCTLLGVSAFSSALIFKEVAIDGNFVTIQLMHWIQSGTMDVSWALKFDTLTAVMMIVVTWVSFMVHVYSVGYMSHDPSIPRFMSYLSLFTFAMLMLVTADNLVQLFFGWKAWAWLPIC
jgi:NADH-quinone oxidoreductase subunit L